MPREAYHRDLTTLHKRILALASSARRAVEESVLSLRAADLDWSRRIDAEDEQINAERLAIEERCIALIAAQQTAFNQATVGRTIPVLVEKAGRKPGQMAGKSPYLQAVQIDDAKARIGDIVEVNVTGLGTNSLYARELS